MKGLEVYRLLGKVGFNESVEGDNAALVSGVSPSTNTDDLWSMTNTVDREALQAPGSNPDSESVTAALRLSDNTALDNDERDSTTSSN